MTITFAGVMFKLREKRCSFNKTVFEEDRDSFNCQSSINVYHCIQNEKNRSGEICIQPVWVQPNYCPEYNTGANTLDTVPCNVSTGSCPDVLFLSNEVYKYPVCLNKTYTDDGNVLKENIQSPPWMFVGVLIGVFSLIMLIVAVCCCVCCIRRKKSNKKKDEESYQLLLEKEECFHKTAAYHEGLNFINVGGKLLCLIGRWGSGKTSTAKQIYMSVTNTHPKVIKNPLTFDVSNQPVIFDESVSRGISDVEKELLREKITKLYENMLRSKIKAFIIFTLDEDMESFCSFLELLVSSKEDIKYINLSKSLTPGDRNQILHSQFQTFCDSKAFNKVEMIAKCKEDLIGYPEICALFCRCTHFQTVGPVLFCNRPLQYLRSYLENMHRSNDNEKFLMLVYMSLNQMEINVNEQNDILFEILESCNCGPTRKETKSGTKPIEFTGTEVTLETNNTEYVSSSENKPKTHHRSRKDVISLISKEFVDKEARASVYRLHHDVIKRMTLIVFGTYHFDTLLELSKPEELEEWVKEKSKTFIVAQGDIKPVLEIDGEQWRQYQAKYNDDKK